MAARKALCAFMSVVLVVGFMPGWMAWGETAQAATVAGESLDVSGGASNELALEEESTADSGVTEDPENGNEGVGDLTVVEGADTLNTMVGERSDDENEEEDDEADNVTVDDDGQVEEGEELGSTDEEHSAPLDAEEETAESGDEVVEPQTLLGPLALANAKEAQLSAALAPQADLTTQATYSITYTIDGNAANKRSFSGSCAGAVGGDTVTFTMINNMSVASSVEITRIPDGSSTGQKYTTVSVPKKSSSTWTYTVQSNEQLVTARMGNTYSKIALVYKTRAACTVTLNYNGGAYGSATSSTANGYAGNAIHISASPTRSGYTFSGWNTAANGSGTHYNNGTSPTFSGNTTLYAEWTRKVTLTTGTNGSTSTSSPITFYYDSAGNGRPSSATLQLSGLNGWSAVGWTTGGNADYTASVSAGGSLSASSLSAASTTYRAILQRTLSVKYDANGADAGTSAVPANSTVTQYVNSTYNTNSGTKKSVTLAAPGSNLAKQGYKFVGWTIDGQLYDMVSDTTYTWANANSTAQVTAYATWERASYDPNEVSVSLDGWTYGDAGKTPVVTATDGAESAVIEYSTSKTGSYSKTQPKDAGTYWVRATVPAHGGYLEGEASTSFTIAPRTIGISWSDTSFTYDGKTHAPKATATGLVGSDACAITVAGEQTNVGAYTASATAVGNSNYKLPSTGTTCDFTIGKAQLTVTAKDNKITYGDAPAANGVTYSGFGSGDSASKLSGSLAYAYSYTQYQDAGSYTITPSGLSSPNYDIRYVAGTLTVEPREVTLTWAVPDSFTYDGSSHSWPVPTVGNTVNGDALTAVWAEGSGAAVATATEIGDYKPKVGSLEASGSAKASNYKLPSKAEGSWSITMPSTNSMTVSIAGWTYGKYKKSVNGPTVTAEYGANTVQYAYYKDNNGSLGDQVTGNDLDSNGVPKNVGSYWVKATIGGTSKYPAAEATCAFSITKADITVTADDKQSVRSDSGTIANLTCTVSGDVASWDKGSLAGYFQAASEESPNDIKLNASGSYTIKATWATGQSAENLPNYNVTFVDGTYTVTRLLASVTAEGSSWVYDGTSTDKGIKVTVNDSVSGKALDGSTDAKVSVYYSESTFANIIDSSVMSALQNADTIDDTFKSNFSTLTTAISNGNYATTSPTYKTVGTHRVYFIVVSDQATPDVMLGYKDVVITRAPLVVTAGTVSIGYGDPAPEAPTSNPAYTITGFVNGETESGLRALSPAELSGEVAYDSPGYTTTSKPGTYPIMPKGLSATNYSITYAPGTLTVGAKEITLKWPETNSFAYTGAAQTYRPTLDGVPSGADVQVSMTAGTDTATAVGSYTATVAGLTGNDAANYVLKSDAVLMHDWSITKAALTVTANAATITYGDAPAGSGVTYSGFISPDDENSLSGTLEYTFDYRQFGDIGSNYNVTPGGLSSPNYDITFVAGKLTVNPRELALNWPMPDQLLYTGSELTYGQPTLGNIVNNDDVSIGTYSGNTGTAGGVYTAKVESLTGTKAGNYVLPSDAQHDWTIYGAPNSASVTLADWTYGDSPNEPRVTALHNADQATFKYGPSEFGPFDSTAPTNKTNAGTYWVEATIPGSSIYEQAVVYAEFRILPREVTLTWSNTAFTYDGEEHVPTATVGGLVNGDSCTAIVEGAKKEQGVHTATATLLSNTNYALPANTTQLFTIAARALTVTAKDATITYGDAPKGAGVTYTGFADGDDESVLSGTLAYTYNYAQYDDVGTGTFTITPGGLASTDYAITYVPGTLTVNPREVTLTWAVPNSFAYDGEEHTWGLPTVGNTVNGDELTAVWATASGANDVATATNAGNYAPVVGSLSGDKAANYKLPSGTTGEWSITASTTNNMTVSIADWTYGKYTAACGPNVTADYGASTVTYTYYTDVNGSLGTQVTGSDLDSTYGVSINAGKYWVKASIPADANNNYPATEATSAFTIAKADITVTADDKVSVRSTSGSLSDLTFTVSGDFVQADRTDLENNYVELSTTATGISSVGSWPITAAWKTGVTEHPNYNITFAGGTYTVTRSIANVAATGYSGTYDGVADTEHISVSVTDTAGSDPYATGGTASITVYYSDKDFKDDVGESVLKTLQEEENATSEAFQTAWSSFQSTLSTKKYTTKATDYTYKNAGTYRVYFMVVSDQATPDVIVGYKEIVIAKAPLVVTAKDKTIGYGDEAANDGVEYATFVNGETASVLGGTLAYDYGSYTTSSVPGLYPITPSGLTSSNYDITFAPGTLTVTGIPLTLVWSTTDSFAYNAQAQTYATPTLSGLPGGADVQVVTGGTYTATAGGTYTATVTGLSGTDAAIYTLARTAQLSHDWTITPAQLTVTALPSTITYGDAPTAADVEYEGFVGDDDESCLTGSLSYAYTYAWLDDVGTGMFTITPGGLASPSYTITFKPGILTVNKRVLTMEWPTPDEFEYTGVAIRYPVPTLVNVVNDNVSVNPSTYLNRQATDVGTYEAQVQLPLAGKADNYIAPMNLKHPWRIVGEANNASISIDGWVYGQEPNRPEFTADFGDENVTFAYFTDAACTEPVDRDDLDTNGIPFMAGTYWVKGSVPAGTSYEAAEAIAGFVIEQRTLTVTAADQIVKVGEDIATGLGQVTVEGLLDGDELTGIELTSTSTDEATQNGEITPSAAVVQRDDERDVTSCYDITYEPGRLLVVADFEEEDGKVIYVMYQDVWKTVAEIEELLAAEDADEQLIEMAGATAYEVATRNSLDVEVADRGGLAAEAGVYTVTFTTPGVSVRVSTRVHVMDSGEPDDETGVIVYANDITPDYEVLSKAKAGDADAIAALIELAQAVGVDLDGKVVPVVGLNLSDVTHTALGTYPATYSTAEGESAVANITVAQRSLTVTAARQIVKVGESIATDVGQVAVEGLEGSDVLAGIKLTGTPTDVRTQSGEITPSAAVVQNADGTDVTSCYDITYEPGELLVVDDYSTENGKVIYILHKDVWLKVSEAERLLASEDVDAQLISLAVATAYEVATGDPLEVEVSDRGGLVAAVGVYTVTFKTNPEVSAQVHVMGSGVRDEKTGVTVYANDTEPDPNLLEKAKAGDADAIAALIELAQAVGIDDDGNVVPVTGIDLSGVDLSNPGTYPARYSTDEGASAQANVTFYQVPDSISATKADKVRKAAPKAGDALLATASILALAGALAAAIALFARRRSVPRGRHAE